MQRRRLEWRPASLFRGSSLVQVAAAAVGEPRGAVGDARGLLCEISAGVPHEHHALGQVHLARPPDTPPVNALTASSQAGLAACCGTPIQAGPRPPAHAMCQMS